MTQKLANGLDITELVIAWHAATVAWYTMSIFVSRMDTSTSDFTVTTWRLHE